MPWQQLSTCSSMTIKKFFKRTCLITICEKSSWLIFNIHVVFLKSFYPLFTIHNISFHLRIDDLECIHSLAVQFSYFRKFTSKIQSFFIWITSSNTYECSEIITRYCLKMTFNINPNPFLIGKHSTPRYHQLIWGISLILFLPHANIIIRIFYLCLTNYSSILLNIYWS